MQKFIKATTLVTLLYSSSLLADDYLSAFTTNFDPINSIENMVSTNNNGDYDITGYFAPYTFGSDVKSNWTFTFSSKYGGDTYQLLGDTSEENIKKNGIFGWVKKDVIPNDPMFYMVQYESTPFGWLLFDIDENGNCKNIYKLAGQNPTTKSFSYDVDGDGKNDTLDGLSCKVSGERVKFFSVSANQTFKFTKEWLNDKTLYYVGYTDLGYDELEKKWNLVSMNFSQDTLVLQEYNTPDTTPHTLNYSITDQGWIYIETEDEDNTPIRPIELTDDYVKVCLENACNSDNPLDQEYLFFDYQKAKDFVDAKNIELNSQSGSDNVTYTGIYTGTYTGTYSLTGGTKANSLDYCETGGTAYLIIDENQQVSGKTDTGLIIDGLILNNNIISGTTSDGTKWNATINGDKITGTYDYNGECIGTVEFIKSYGSN